MIDKPIYRMLQNAVGETCGPYAIAIVLEELSKVFEQFADECERLYDDDPDLDKYSRGYLLASNWCDDWASDIRNEHG